MKDYFLIQQYRYGGSISLECEISEEALYDCLIHRFTLQPLIENALFHGIEPKGCAGKIRISANLDREAARQPRLIISVWDNGIGMDAETIKRVLSGTQKPTADFFRQVGINNVNSGSATTAARNTVFPLKAYRENTHVCILRCHTKRHRERYYDKITDC